MPIRFIARMILCFFVGFTGRFIFLPAKRLMISRNTRQDSLTRYFTSVRNKVVSMILELKGEQTSEAIQHSCLDCADDGPQSNSQLFLLRDPSEYRNDACRIPPSLRFGLTCIEFTIAASGFMYFPVSLRKRSLETVHF